MELIVSRSERIYYYEYTYLIRYVDIESLKLQRQSSQIRVILCEKLKMTESSYRENLILKKGLLLALLTSLCSKIHIINT